MEVFFPALARFSYLLREEHDKYSHYVISKAFYFHAVFMQKMINKEHFLTAIFVWITFMHVL